MLFTSSQNFGFFKENSQVCAGKQVKYVDFISDCSFGGWALVLVTLNKKKSFWYVDTNLIYVGILKLNSCRELLMFLLQLFTPSAVFCYFLSPHKCFYSR